MAVEISNETGSGRNIVHIERIHQQITDNFEKAFFDLLKQKVAEDPPDYDWLGIRDT